MSARLQYLLIAVSVVPLGTVEALAQLTPVDRQEALDAHNQLRCSVDPPAQAMPALTWDPLLERVAQEWADTCPTTHNASRTSRYQELGGSGYVGENQAWGYSTIGLAVFYGWGGERAWYDYSSNTCHPVQSSGAAATTPRSSGRATLRVGCALPTVSCPNFSGKYYVCNYAPGGNHEGQSPYVRGTGVNEACAATPTNVAPLADAGPDQVVSAGALVTLDGAGSFDPNGVPITFAWTQIAGPVVTLNSTTVAQPTFSAPRWTQTARP